MPTLRRDRTSTVPEPGTLVAAERGAATEQLRFPMLYAPRVLIMIIRYRDGTRPHLGAVEAR